MSLYSFCLPVPPVPYTRQTQNTRWSPHYEGSQEQRYERYKQDVRAAFSALALPKSRFPLFQPLQLTVRVLGNMQADLSNLVKGIEDAFNPLKRGKKGARTITPCLWDDDSQIMLYGKGTGKYLDHAEGAEGSEVEVLTLFDTEFISYLKVTGVCSNLVNNLVSLQHVSGAIFLISLPARLLPLQVGISHTFYLYHYDSFGFQKLIGFSSLLELRVFTVLARVKGFGVHKALALFDKHLAEEVLEKRDSPVVKASKGALETACSPLSPLDDGMLRNYSEVVYAVAQVYNVSPRQARSWVELVVDRLDWHSDLSSLVSEVAKIPRKKA